MPVFTTTSPEILRARYRSLSGEIPILIFTALSATAMQIVALTGEVSWTVAVGLPVIRMALGALIFLYWLRHRHDQPSVSQIRWRLRIASGLLVLAGIVTFLRTLYLFHHTGPFGHYFLIIDTLLYGLCFAFILSRLGLATYLYNLLLVAATITCIFLGGFEQPHLLTGLILVFEFGVLLAMRESNHVFDQWVHATYATHTLSAENQRLAHQDTLTCLPNRRQFFLHVEQRLANVTPTMASVAVGIVDLDNFKPVNDAYGHHVGDLVLVEIGLRLSRIRVADVQFYRLGGDEFAFQLTTDAGQATLTHLGKEITHVIAQPMQMDGIPITIKASIGACVYVNTRDTAQDLYEHADFALYHAKRTGRGSMEIYSRQLEQARLHLSKVDQALRTADLEAELFPVFQPIVHVSTGEVSSFESLARWNSAKLGVVAPDMFIGVAESLGMVSDITRLMFKKALVAMAAWPAHVRLSFNLSAYDVTNKAVIEELADVVRGSGIHPERFIFEITETALLQDFATARENVELLRQAGARIALDDFGTGYSSLSHVQNLPLDKLKIDRSFIRDIETNATSQTIVRSILALCQGMQIECVAEGAETENQVKFLQAMGCQLIQGYFYARPMAQEQLESYLAMHA